MSGPNSANRPAKFSRRDFLFFSIAMASTLGFARWQNIFGNSKNKFQLKRKIPGSIKGASSQVGHLIRESQQLVPTREKSVSVAIVGSGISGLSAGWWLDRHGFKDFHIFELENKFGGNSQSDGNEISRYPWGAHYLPIPNPNAEFVIELLKEAGVITGKNLKGQYIYKDEFLCHDPKERLFMEGHWQDNLVPGTGLSETENKEIRAFIKMMEGYENRKGSDGKPVFTLPIAHCSQDPLFLKLDDLSMAQFLDSQSLKCKPLRWYVDYCCLDDYGARADKISAWMGIQYFASRTGEAANAESNSVLTWPEGNGWLVNYLQGRIGDRMTSGALVTSIEVHKDRAEILSLDVRTKELTKIKCEKVIYAAPRFTAPYVIKDNLNNKRLSPSPMEYDPWMVANITLDSRPGGDGAPLSWDNVSYHTSSLGYIVANHQNLEQPKSETVVTLYWPLVDASPTEERKRALLKSHEEWVQQIAQELEALHPGIESSIRNIDVWIWGHAMARPAPGIIWGSARRTMHESIGKILHFAHSDMSGYSVFEEAQYWGVEAAKKILASGSKKHG